MTAWAELVREIRTDPDADAPRLVAADWLMDRGDPRGEYIVLACELARLVRELAPGSAERTALEARFRALYTTRWEASLVALGAKPADPYARQVRATHLELRRGFVEAIELVGGAITRFAEACRCEPIVELIATSPGPRQCAQLADMPELAQLRALSLGGRHADGWELVLASQRLGGIRALRLPVMLTPAVVAVLAQGTARPHALDHIGLDNVDALVDHGLLVNVTELAPFRAADPLLAALARAPLANLRRLRLWESPVTARGFAALGARLGQLESLEFIAAPFDPAIVPILVAHVTPRLRRLVLSGFTCPELAAFVESPAFAGVEAAELKHGVYDDHLHAAFERSAYRAKLRTLFVPGTRGYRLDGVRIEDVGY